MIHSTYFHRVQAETSTRFWINNPTLDEARKALNAGAVGCTTNPSYVSKLLASPADAAYVDRAIAMLIPYIPDNSQVAAIVQRLMVARLSELFMPLYDATAGKQGFVTIQGDPYDEIDAAKIVEDGLKNRIAGPNIMVKIPVTIPGIKAIKDFVKLDIPVMATEVMGLSQAVAIAEAYEEIAKQSGNTPPFFVTHITGILDDHFKRVIESQGIEISKDAVAWAGLSIAKKQYALYKDRQYQGLMIGGGARKLEDFTELVGLDMHITINWKGSAQTLLDIDGPVVSRAASYPGQKVIDELLKKLPDYRRAYEVDGMKPDEFYDYGGVELFRTSFMMGWNMLLDRIVTQRRRS